MEKLINLIISGGKPQIGPKEDAIDTVTDGVIGRVRSASGFFSI